MTEINIGTIIEKVTTINEDGTTSTTYDEALYFNCAVWCNENNASIQEFEDRYEVVANPEPELDDVKASKLAELKNTRDTREQSPLPYNDNTYDYDLKSVAKLNEARDKLIKIGGTQVWITATNTIVYLTLEDIDGIKLAGADRSNALHIKYAQLREYVNALESVEDVNAVTFDMSLPETELLNN